MIELLKQTIEKLTCDEVLKENNGNMPRDMLIDYIKNNKKYRNKAISDIATELNVARGTVTRWIELKNVPKNYRFDLMKLCNLEIDYTQYSFKDKDQFFTTLDMAKQCYEIFKNKH